MAAARCLTIHSSCCRASTPASSATRRPSRLAAILALRLVSMSDRRTIPLVFTLDGRVLASETTCVWAGPYVLTISTVLPDHGLAVEVHSTFVGHEGVPTYATHLTIGPVDHDPTIAQDEHPHASLDPVLRARDCAYEHIQLVLSTLQQLDYDAAIDVPEDAFADMERVAPR
jgi:hypothetical protein